MDDLDQEIRELREKINQLERRSLNACLCPPSVLSGWALVERFETLEDESKQVKKRLKQLLKI